MTVRELIKTLQSYNPDMPVAYATCSEHCELEAEELETKELCKPRDDGWLQRKRPDMPTTVYLVFPA